MQIKFPFLSTLSLLFVSVGCRHFENTEVISYPNAFFRVEKRFHYLLDEKYLRLKLVKEVDRDQANHLMENKQKTDNEYFVSNIEPYYGKDTVPRSCQLDQLPAIKNGENDDEILQKRDLFSSNQFQLGCLTKSPVFAQSLLLYCKKSKKFYYLLFLPEGQSWHPEPFLHCP